MGQSPRIGFALITLVTVRTAISSRSRAYPYPRQCSCNQQRSKPPAHASSPFTAATPQAIPSRPQNRHKITASPSPHG
ncbi:exported hypothetical protein [uncultured Stenotrophomonas sp.]|uniref:Uncharacterized protein n=1 Tax=uncultured Stenotrophomonas sp. TaxID=165438 RepID=A0A1Y5Q167_9GAMM|nr:exported hypothetical protein [uncultured Stenotrophomonas sp.]